MARNLREVIAHFGYPEEEKQVAFMKLAAYRGCFEDKEPNRLIADEEAKALLDLSFDNLAQGINWWVDTIDKKWLRSSFQKEGISKGNDPVINTLRWELDEKKAESMDEIEFLKLFTLLGLVNEVSWPEVDISNVVIHGAPEKHAAERINFIHDFAGALYYMTSPRGLFNDEPSLPFIIADWFEQPDYVEKIQIVLRKHHNIRLSDKHWLKDIQGLKEEILDAIGEETWPTKGWYFKNPKPFDEAALAEGRQLLNGWPTALDMVEYLLKQRQISVPGKFNNIEVFPVYSVRPGRVPNTEDNVQDWFLEYGKNINEPVIFVTNNSLGMHYIHFQDEITKKTLKNLGTNLDFITVGPGAKDISLSSATDVFAKLFYSKRPALLKQLKETEDKFSSGFFSQDQDNLGEKNQVVSVSTPSTNNP